VAFAGAFAAEAFGAKTRATSSMLVWPAHTFAIAASWIIGERKARRAA
jgi:hypothetical protein